MPVSGGGYMLPTKYQEFIHLSRYARFRDVEGRRETWSETVDRLISYWYEKLDGKEDLSEIEDAILNLDVMPSMRSLMTAGDALDRDNVAGYNCSYLPIDHPRAFDEAMYILMCGTGVGFSVERQFTSKLPVVSEEFHETSTTIKVRDSKIGWASAYKELIALLYQGRIPEWDVSGVRGAGERLKTFGGRASGAEPLEDLFRFTIATFKRGAGRKLSSLECHDLMCKVGEIVVVGGVRRSALISLSNLSDDRMREAKSGQWWEHDSQRALANNSVSYTEKPDMTAFMKEWKALYMSKSGERGIFNRNAAKKLAPERRDTDHEFGTNPCSEIVLRPNQFCNLTEVIVRPEDTLDELKEKVRIATIIGTFQSTLTNFRYLRSIWQKNTEEERLLGVSLTGICDHPILNGGASVVYTDLTTDGQTRMPKLRLEKWLREMKEVAIETNKTWADRLGIPVSTSITCVKPSGTVSQLTDTASGIHPRHSDYYVRTVRQDNKDPLTQFMIDKGFVHEPAFGKEDTTTVFSFPAKSPENSLMRDDRNAIEQLELWLTYQLHWCEHKPSITVYVMEHEWMEVGAWVYKHFDYMSGVSFLPFDGGSYKQAPYQDCTKEEYEELLALTPEVDWTELVENEDNTTSSQTLACVGPSCEI
jgi:ribonucleoside-diphosphate reductase alpha chain